MTFVGCMPLGFCLQTGRLSPESSLPGTTSPVAGISCPAFLRSCGLPVFPVQGLGYLGLCVPCCLSPQWSPTMFCGSPSQAPRRFPCLRPRTPVVCYSTPDSSVQSSVSLSVPFPPPTPIFWMIQPNDEVLKNTEGKNKSTILWLKDSLGHFQWPIILCQVPFFIYFYLFHIIFT